MSFVKLPPSGRYVVRETADPKKVNTITTFESARMQSVEWVNDIRLTWKRVEAFLDKNLAR